METERNKKTAAPSLERKNRVTIEPAIIEIIRQHLPEVEAIYLFGTWGTEKEWPDSDLDLAVLLPPRRAKEAGALALSGLE